MYMSHEGAELVDWNELQRVYDAPEWNVYYGEEIIGTVKADTFEEARDRGVEYARMIGYDLAIKQIYAIRKDRKRPTSLLRWPTQKEKDKAAEYATWLQISLNQYVVNAVIAQNDRYREQATDDDK